MLGLIYVRQSLISTAIIMKFLVKLLNIDKNAAKRSRQHAGKKYREYAERRVCFVNEQVP